MYHNRRRTNERTVRNSNNSTPHIPGGAIEGMPLAPTWYPYALGWYTPDRYSSTTTSTATAAGMHSRGHLSFTEHKHISHSRRRVRTTLIDSA